MCKNMVSCWKHFLAEMAKANRVLQVKYLKIGNMMLNYCTPLLIDILFSIRAKLHEKTKSQTSHEKTNLM